MKHPVSVVLSEEMKCGVLQSYTFAKNSVQHLLTVTKEPVKIKVNGCVNQ